MGTHLIAEIKIGRRHRRDMGNLDDLAASIGEVGLLHPVVIRPDGRLIAGERRIKACKALGWLKVPTTVVNLDEVVRGEYAENTERKDFTWTEAVAIKHELEPLERAAAKERQAAAGPKSGKGAKRSGVGNLPTPLKGRATDKAAKATGKKRRSLEKAEAVVAAAKDNPEKYGDLLARLDEPDAKVEAIHREMKQRQARSTYEATAQKGGVVSDLTTLADKQKFSVIYADPPWSFEVYSGKGKQRSADRHYDTMSLDAIKAMPIGSLAADDCALFLWGVWPELPGALDVIKSWGFEYKTAGFLWVKTVSATNDAVFTGMGYWTRANSEPCLLATRGSPFRLANDVPQVVFAPVGAHSEKPQEVRSRIERLLAGPYLELFGRSRVDGWTVWGNEIEQAA